MAPTVIHFEESTTSPPVFVAGSFSDWQATELEAVEGKDEHGQARYYFQKTFELLPGTYQYKFRLGRGDWWVCDNQKPKAWDLDGNENNVLIVEDDRTKVQLSETSNSHQLREHRDPDGSLSSAKLEYAPTPHTDSLNGTALGEHVETRKEAIDSCSEKLIDANGAVSADKMRIGKLDAEQQEHMLSVKSEAAANGQAGPREDPRMRPGSKRESNPVIPWPFGGSKRLMLMVVVFALPVAMAYYLKKGGLRF